MKLKREAILVGAVWGLISWFIALSSVSGRWGTVGAFTNPFTILLTLPTYIPYNLFVIIAAIHRLMEPIAMVMFFGTLIPILPIITGVILVNLLPNLHARFNTLERNYKVRIVISITAIFTSVFLLLWWSPWLTEEEAISQAKSKFLEWRGSYYGCINDEYPCDYSTTGSFEKIIKIPMEIYSINAYKKFCGYDVLIHHPFREPSGRSWNETETYHVSCLGRICDRKPEEILLYNLIHGCY